MSVCIFFFILGFLTDKLRVFPLVMGILLGLVIRSVLDEGTLRNVRSQIGSAVDSILPHMSIGIGPSKVVSAPLAT